MKTILNSELACTSKKEEIITPSTATINLPTQFIFTSTVNFALSNPFSSNNAVLPAPFSSNNVVLPAPFSFNNNTSSVSNSTYNSNSSSTSFPMHSTISLTQNQIEIDLEEIKNVISKEIKKQFEQQAQATRQKKRDSSNSTKAGNVFTHPSQAEKYITKKKMELEKNLQDLSSQIRAAQRELLILNDNPQSVQSTLIAPFQSNYLIAPTQPNSIASAQPNLIASAQSNSIVSIQSNVIASVQSKKRKI